jgi:hypothetical protein
MDAGTGTMSARIAALAVRLWIALSVLLAVPPHVQAAFDHEHTAWSALLQKHVVLRDGGRASSVSYAGFSRDRGLLKAYLGALSAVPESEFAAWSKPQQLAFLINAYNAFTIEKILMRYPDIRSIRDFGKLIGNPWKDRFFTLFGRDLTLDGIEHDMIRAPGRYEDPRIHFAVNCASIGCPMLREEAYVAARLEVQLDEQALRFMSDRTRNRYEAAARKLALSSIFDWYGKDFARGWKGYASLDQWLVRYADQLADKPEERAAIRAGGMPLTFLDYDWRLNDAR